MVRNNKKTPWGKNHNRVDNIRGIKDRKHDDNPPEEIDALLKLAKEETIEKWKTELKKKGFSSCEIFLNLTNEYFLNFEKYILQADLAVKIGSYNFLIVKIEPLNRPIVPLERRTISISRIIDDRPFHYALLTNSRDELLIDVRYGGSKEKGEFKIPTREEFLKTKNIDYKISKEQIDKEKRIFATFDSLKCNSCDLD